MRGIVLGLGLLLVGLALGVLAGVAEDGADGALDCTGSGVDIRLEGRGLGVVVGRHIDGDLVWSGVVVVWIASRLWCEDCLMWW